jgi:hypothetical protein
VCSSDLNLIDPLVGGVDGRAMFSALAAA